MMVASTDDVSSSAWGVERSIVDQAIVNTVLSNGRRFYNPRRDQAFIPVELKIAYRFGHTMVRPSYRANLKGDHGQPFFGMIFDPAGEGSVDPVDLRGGARASRRFIGWQTFFDFGGPLSGDVRPNKRIDTKISTPLFRLPLGAIASGTPPTSLVQRNLLRCLTWQLPSGQAIAERMGLTPLAAADLAELQPILPAFVGSTPLFYYILKEAQVIENGGVWDLSVDAWSRRSSLGCFRPTRLHTSRFSQPGYQRCRPGRGRLRCSG